MVLKPANKKQIILRCHNFENILNGNIQHHPFVCGGKGFVNIFPYGLLNNKLQREAIIYYFIYSGARKVCH